MILPRRAHAVLLAWTVVLCPVALRGYQIGGADSYGSSAVQSSLPATATVRVPSAVPPRSEVATAVAEVGVEEKIGAFLPLDLVFTNHHGQQVRLQQLIDRPTLLVPVYYRCPSGCNLELANLADAIRRSRQPIGSFRVISVSFDADETPAVAAETRPNFTQLLGKDFPEEAWVFLTGDQAAIAGLTAAIGFAFQKKADGTFIHPSTMVALAADGRIIKYIYGTFIAGDVDLALAEAAKGEPTSSIRRLLEFCFPANPRQSQQVLQMLKWASLALLVAGGLGLAWLLRRKPSDHSTFGPKEP